MSLASRGARSAAPRRGIAHIVAWCAALLITAVSPIVSAQTPASTSLPGAEGPLANDAWLPVSLAAEAQLAAGDQLYAELRRKLAARTTPGAADSREWSAVFEAWRAALALGHTGEGVSPRPVDARGSSQASPWPDPDGTAGRRIEGLEAAVARRFAELSPEERGLWTARFEPLAQERLDQARGDATQLARLDRELPWTRAASRAGLALADRQLEEGRPDLARAWLDRAQVHLAAAAIVDAAIQRALELRRAACDANAPSREPDASPRASWERANELKLLDTLPLLPGEARRPRRNNAARADPDDQPYRGVQPGLAFLERNRAAIQLPDLLALVDLTAGTLVASQRTSDLLEPFGLAPPLVAADADKCAWPLTPVTDGRAVVMVEGRSRGDRSNALVCLEPGRPDETVPFRLRWCLTPERLVDRAGVSRPWPVGRGLAGGEFQPGPLLVGSLIVVQVRQATATSGAGGREDPRNASGAEWQSWLVAVDLATGQPSWTVLFSKGTELTRDLGRFAPQSGSESAGQPLARVGLRVFAGTGLGTGALIDALDGRLVWALKNRRREAARRGWAGGTPPVFADPPGVLWAPTDGDFLYWLRAEPLTGGSRLFLDAPHPIAEAEALLTGDAGQAVVLSRAGAVRSASTWDAAHGGRRDAFELAPLETFTGPGLASKERALFATDRGLYLSDRDRDGWLVDYEELPGSGPKGGTVFARGGRVAVLGHRTLWIFEVVR